MFKVFGLRESALRLSRINRRVLRYLIQGAAREHYLFIWIQGPTPRFEGTIMLTEELTFSNVMLIQSFDGDARPP